MSTKLNDLHAEMVRQTKSVKKYKAEIIQLQTKVKQYENSRQNSHEKESNLNNTIRDLQLELDEQQEKFDEDGNPDYNELTKLEGFMKKKFDQVEKKLEQVMKDNKYADSVKDIQGSRDILAIHTENPDLDTIMKEARNDELVEESTVLVIRF